MSYWDDFDYFPPSQPKKVEGGIKAQSQKGGFGKNWWVKRWIAVLEGFRIGARLNRGKSYARSGQVLSIDIAKGKVKARVQGSRSRPYNVEITVKPLADTDWQRLSTSLNSRPIYAAKLLAGEMPPDIEEVFTQTGLSLFPERYQDLHTYCSCPDATNPCKHIAAVYYLLGEEFDRDPFLIFRLRGQDRQELITALGALENTPPPKSTTTDSTHPLTTALNPPLPTASVPEPKEDKHSDPVLINLSSFWRGTPFTNAFHEDIQVPTHPAPLIRQLGNFPFWRGNQNLNLTLQTLYAEASQAGLNLITKLAERSEEDPKPNPE